MKIVFNDVKTGTSSQAITWQVGRDSVDEMATHWQISMESSSSGGFVTITAQPPRAAAAMPVAGGVLDQNNRIPIIIDGIIKKLTFTPDASCTANATSKYYVIGWHD